MSISDLVRKWMIPKIDKSNLAYVIEPYCPYESVGDMIRSCTILHKDCQQIGSYKKCKYYKTGRKNGNKNV